MTLSSTTVRTLTALGNGVNLSHVIGFPFRDNDDIQVWVEEQSASPFTLTQLVFGAGAGKFTITGGDPGTTVLMGTALSATQRAILKRVSPKTQPVDYIQTSAFPADDHEEQVDKQMMSIQEEANKVTRTLQLWDTSTINPRFPSNLSAGQMLRVDDAGTGVTGGMTETALLAAEAAAVAAAVAAAASATSAAVSAGAASTSQAAAAASAAAALASQVAAAASEAAALASEVAAAASAVTAAAAAAAAVAAALGTKLQEAPAGAINDSNATFVLTFTPLFGPELDLWIDGFYQRQGVDYTLAVATITMTNPPATGQDIWSKYAH